MECPKHSNVPAEMLCSSHRSNAQRAWAPAPPRQPSARAHPDPPACSFCTPVSPLSCDEPLTCPPQWAQQAQLSRDSSPNHLDLTVCSRWMADCSNDLWAQRLKDLLLPGSHNAHAYAFHPQRLGAPLPKMLQLISPLLSPLVSAWGKAQSVPVLGQLLLGSRYLDIRIDKSTLCGTFFTTHGMAGPSLIAILSAVSSFLRNEHFQNELLVLDVQKTHSIESSSDHEAVLDEIATYLSDLLVPATQGLAELTYGECISSNKRVVVLYGGARDDDDIAASALERNVWPRHDCFLWSPWPKSRSLSQLREHFKVAPKLAKRAPGFFVLQGVCTPNAQIVQQGVLKRSAPSDLHELAQAVTPTAFGWARELEMSCVVMCDYIDCCAGEIALMLAERYPTFAERLELQYREAKSKVE